MQIWAFKSQKGFYTVAIARHTMEDYDLLLVHYGIFKVWHDIKAQLMQKWVFKLCKGIHIWIYHKLKWYPVVHDGIFKVQYVQQAMQSCCVYSTFVSGIAQRPEPKRGAEV